MIFQNELVDIVDEQDTVIGTIYRKDEIYGKHILRSTSIFLLNSKKQILLQLRAKESKRYPLHWDVSGGGHVNSGESYQDCAKRELFEEIGIQVEYLNLLKKHHFTLDNNRKRINSSYVAIIEETKILIDPVEVADARWFSISEINKMIENNEKFHPECEFLLKQYLLN